MKRRPLMRLITLTNGRCGLSVESKRDILRSEGTSNVREVRNATAKDLEWVRGMGGNVPDGRIAKLPPKTSASADSQNTAARVTQSGGLS